MQWHNRNVDDEARENAVNQALDAVRRGDDGALASLFDEVYAELAVLAHRQRRRWVGQDTLDTSALVHDCFLKLADRDRLGCVDMRHFYAVAAKAMRHILIDYALRRGTRKRGGDRQRVDLTDAKLAAHATQETLVAVGVGLDRLAAMDPRRASVFECRFFLGMGVAETAETLGISPATVKRDWALAAAFLQVQLEG